MNAYDKQQFPLQGGFRAIQSLTLVAVLLMAILSGLGMAFPGLIYPGPNLADEFVTNDLVNLVIGLPFFLVSLYYFQKRNLLGLLLLPGALIYTIYNYFAYLLGKPLDWTGGLNLVLVLLCGSILYFLLSSLDHEQIKDKLKGKTSERLAGWVLIVFGVAFIGLALSDIIPGIINGSIPPLGEKAVSAADILVSIGWVYGGALLLRQKSLGYSLGLGLLLAASNLFIGLILYFFFAPLFTDRTLDWIEVLTILVMGMVFFAPTFLFLRGAVRGQKA